MIYLTRYTILKFDIDFTANLWILCSISYVGEKITEPICFQLSVNKILKCFLFSIKMLKICYFFVPMNYLKANIHFRVLSRIKNIISRFKVNSRFPIN